MNYFIFASPKLYIFCHIVRPEYSRNNSILTANLARLFYWRNPPIFLGRTCVANLIWYFHCHFVRNTAKTSILTQWDRDRKKEIKANILLEGTHVFQSTKRGIIYHLRQIWQPRHQRRHMNVSIAERSLISCRVASNMNEFTQEKSVIHASIVISASPNQDIVNIMNELTQERSHIHVIIVIKASAPHHNVSNMNELTQVWDRIHASIAARPFAI